MDNTKKPVFIHSQELEKYSYPPDSIFVTQRASKTRELMNNKIDLVVTPAAGMGASMGSQGDRRPELHQGSRPGVPADYSAQVGLLKIIGNATTSKLNFYAFIRNQRNFKSDNSHLPLNCRDINRVLWFYFDLYYSFSAGFDVIVFFEAYKMQHSGMRTIET